MAELERRQRLEVCFRIDIPPYLLVYRNWGAPATRLRFERIQMHLNMLALASAEDGVAMRWPCNIGQLIKHGSC